MPSQGPSPEESLISEDELPSFPEVDHHHLVEALLQEKLPNGGCAAISASAIAASPRAGWAIAGPSSTRAAPSTPPSTASSRPPTPTPSRRSPSSTTGRAAWSTLSAPRLQLPLPLLPELGDRLCRRHLLRRTVRAQPHAGTGDPVGPESGCQGIAWTYNEPAIWLNYALDCAHLAKQQGLYTVYVTNGYATPEALDAIGPYLDVYRVDVKSFSDEFYRRLIRVPHAQGIREVAKRARERGTCTSNA